MNKSENCNPCPRCGRTTRHIAPGVGIHVASLKCSNCDRWFKWLSKKEFEKLAAEQPEILELNILLAGGES